MVDAIADCKTLDYMQALTGEQGEVVLKGLLLTVK